MCEYKAPIANQDSIDDALDGSVALYLAEQPGLFLLAGENIRAALSRFDALAVETLPVLNSVTQRGVLEADSERAVRSQLRARQLVPLSVEPVTSIWQYIRPRRLTVIAGTLPVIATTGTESSIEVPIPGTRLVASEEKATNRPSALIEGE